MDKASFFILNVFLNSVLAFFTTVLLIEFVVFLFRIKKGRIAALLRMTPIFKLPLDLCLYDFSRWSYAQGVNPFYCEEGTRTLSILFGWTTSPSNWLFLPINSAIQFTIPGDLTFTLSDVVGYMINQDHLKTFSTSLVFFCAFFFVKKLIAHRISAKTLNTLAIHSESPTKKVSSPLLSKLIQKKRCSIYSSSLLQGSPFAAGFFSPIIYIPKHLIEYLSPKEYEATLAHEIEHIRNKDIFISFTLDLIASIFWWIPMKWLRNRIKESQEIRCDSGCKKYGIDPIDLASAIYKSARQAKSNPSLIFAHHLTKHETSSRIALILNPQDPLFPKTSVTFACIAIVGTFLLIFLGKFWTF